MTTPEQIKVYCQQRVIMKVLKYQVRSRWKTLQNLWRNYSGQYASHQVSVPSPLPYLWSEATTPIPNRGTPDICRNRIANLRRAAQGIDCLEISPGQRFSFSHRVGHPTRKNGFQPGPVFIKGEVKTELGGGLCLIATNLFGLFLQAGCEIMERHCHSIDAYGSQRFYTLGQDAAVVYGYKDLIIRNQSQVRLLLGLEILPELGLVRSQLWGEKPRPWEVQIHSTILKEIPGPDPDYYPGWVVATERYLRLIQTTPWAHWERDFSSLSHYHPCRAPQAPDPTLIGIAD